MTVHHGSPRKQRGRIKPGAGGGGSLPPAENGYAVSGYVVAGYWTPE